MCVLCVRHFNPGVDYKCSPAFILTIFSDHNSTFEHLHGSAETYTPMLDGYLHSGGNNSSTNIEKPSPKRRQSLKPRPPPKPTITVPVTIEERIEQLELESQKKTPPRPAPRKRKGILKQPTAAFDHFDDRQESSFARASKGYSSCREDGPRSRRKGMSGYQSEIDPNARKSCSKRHMRRIKSSEGIK